MSDRKRKLQIASILNESSELNFESIIGLIPNDSPMTRTKEVLRKRFVEDLTLEKIAMELGVTKERVRQLQDRGLMYLFDNCLNKMSRFVDVDTRGNLERRYITRSVS